MKRYLFSLLVLLIFPFPGSSSALTDYLRHQPSVEHMEVIEANPYFKEAVCFFVRQPLDHRDPGKGSFLQRVIVSFLDEEAPVVMVTEGYDAGYGLNPRYINELSPLMEASQVVVEHRYFGKSWPDSLRWDYLTEENAAGDHHGVVMLLKPFLSGKWVNTGMSKGGQTALLHRVFFPEDVELTVSYVAPVNYAVEDGRHEPYIARESGTGEGRRKVKEFQKEVLRRRDTLMPLFEKLIREKKYTFRTSVREIYDLTLLEYSFSFWQWGNNPREIPSPASPDTVIFNHWMKIASLDYFSLQEQKRMGSFFVQASREFGYYGYNTRPFRKLLTFRSAKGYLSRVFLPEGINFPFDRSAVLKTQRFLNSTSLPMIFIYGHDDPWTASGVVIPRKSSILKVVQEGGCHRIRIESLDEKNKRLVIGKLNQVIGIETPELAR